MNIFYKRPLALILSITVGGFVFSAYAKITLKIILLVLATALLLFSLLKFDTKYKAVLLCSSVGVIFSIIFSYVYFDLWFKAYERFDDRVSITATVIDSKPITSYTTKLTVKCKNIDGKPLTNYKLVAYLKKEEAADISLGQTINFNADLCDFSSKEVRINSFSNGISGNAENVDNISVVDVKKVNISSSVNRLREDISRYITMLSDAEAGGLLSALIVGERDKLSPQTRLSFKRIGIMHILALSGMHLAILSTGIDKLLLLLQINKKLRVCIITAFIILYMFLTGFPVSVQRAGFMLIIASALFLVAKTKDSFTSLVLSVVLILVFAPFSVYDVALWLSALATFGLILLGEYYANKKKAETSLKKLGNYILIGILSSLFANCATLLISEFTFGGLSLLAIVSTVIFSILIEIIMYLGGIMMLVGSLIPIGKLLSHLCKFTCALADRLADPDCIYLKNDFPTAEVLTVVLTILFFGFAILKIKHKDLYVLIMTVVFAACNILPIINYSQSINNDAISYYSFEKSDVFVIKSEGKVGLISSSQYSKNLAYDTVEILKNESILTLDSYYLTHYSYSVEDDLEIILSNIKTKNLYLPKPTNDDEKAILKKLTRFLSDYSTQINLIGRNESFQMGSCKATHLYTEPYGEDSSMNAFAISNLNETILYLSSGILSTKESELMYDFLSCSDKIILGRHGKKYKEHIYFRETFSRAECIIMNSNNLFLTQEAMEEYTKNGCEIISHPSMVELLD